MQAVILVGGLGTRLRPLTLTTPKPLVPLVNRPVLAHILRWLEAAGVEEAFLATRYAAAAFAPFVERWQGIPVQAVEEPAPLGTAGAVRQLRSALRGTTVVVNGDNICNLDLRALVRRHMACQAQVTIAVDRVADPTGKGVVVCDQAGWVTVFQEKPAPGTALSNIANAGTYVIEPEVLDGIAEGQRAMWETDLFPALIAAKAPVAAAEMPHLWIDVGTPAGYHRAQQLILDRALVEPPGAEIQPGVWAEAQVSLSADALISGGVSLGFGATVAAQAMLDGSVMLGRDVQVLPGATIRQSAIWDETLVEREAYIVASILGYNCYIGAGARLESVVLGDGCVVRNGTVLVPGTTLVPGTIV